MTLEQIIQAYHRNSSFSAGTTLELTYEEISASDVIKLAAVINNSPLTLVNFYSCTFHSEALLTLATALATRETLDSLSLGANQITDSQLPPILTAFATHKNLRVLNLQANRLTEACAPTLYLLKGLPRLSTLNVNDNGHIGDNVGLGLVELLNANSQLTAVSLEGTRIGPSQKQAIQKAISQNVARLNGGIPSDIPAHFEASHPLRLTTALPWQPSAAHTETSLTDDTEDELDYDRLEAEALEIARALDDMDLVAPTLPTSAPSTSGPNITSLRRDIAPTLLQKKYDAYTTPHEICQDILRNFYQNPDNKESEQALAKDMLLHITHKPITNYCAYIHDAINKIDIQCEAKKPIALILCLSTILTALTSAQKPSELIINVLDAWIKACPENKKSLSSFNIFKSAKESPHQFVTKILTHFNVNKQLSFNDCAIYLDSQYLIAIAQKIIVKDDKLAATLQTLSQDLHSKAEALAYLQKLAQPQPAPTCW